MNHKLLSILICPLCSSKFKYAKKGLVCSNKHQFPIVEDVPNLIPQMQDYKRTEISFSKEWGILKNDTPPNMENVRKFFLNDFNINKKQIKNKFILEAGCGRGYLEMAVSEMLGKKGVIVGLDMSTSILLANKKKYKLTKNHEAAQYVRGNIDKPPFKKKSFDMIYSFGVLHHTPDTYNAFKSLLPLLKDNGKFFLGLYRKDRREDTRTVSMIYNSRDLVNRLPLPMIYSVCFILAPLAKVYAFFNTMTGRRPAFNKTIKEFRWSLFDHFSPQYAHRHTIEEVNGWFKELGFKTELKMDDRIGFAILGTKK